MHTEGLETNGFRSRDRPANTSDFRFRKAVCRVLIALSFKSFRRRNERYRRRERSDCSEARILPIVEEERPSEPELDTDNYITAASMVRPLADDRCFNNAAYFARRSNLIRPRNLSLYHATQLQHCNFTAVDAARLVNNLFDRAAKLTQHNNTNYYICC